MGMKFLKEIILSFSLIIFSANCQYDSISFINHKVKKKEMSKIIGEILAKRAVEKKITQVYFDRGSFKYHGRIKSLADALRKNGLNF